MRAGIFNVSGPYAVGKDSIINALLAQFGDQVYRVRTLTTRPVSVEDDPSYEHADPEDFLRRVSTGEWIYNHQLSGATAYATDLIEICDAIANGKVCLHSVYPGYAGAGALRKAFGSQLMSLALLPPGDDVDQELTTLRSRILARNRDDRAALTLRISHQREALEYIRENPKIEVESGAFCRVFDRVLVNADLEETVDEARAIFEERFS